MLLSPLLLLLTLFVSTPQADASKIKALIIDGQNNHHWQETTPRLKMILENAGIFSVDVSTTPPAMPQVPQLPEGATPQQFAAHSEAVRKFNDSARVRQAKFSALWAKWHPHFSDYDVLISNYNGEDWPQEVRAEFVTFIKNGGGFVSFHAADNAFTDWPEYNEMIGIGGWNGRTEQSGPYLRLKNGVWTALQLPGPSGNHGKRHEFLVETSVPDHPIMQGLPLKWMHAQDELYNRLRGPATNVTVLAYAVSDVTHVPEPMLMVVHYGQGRVFHTTLGHDIQALNGLGFQITFARGTEWAATGKVSLPPPGPGELPEGPKAANRELNALIWTSPKGPNIE